MTKTLKDFTAQIKTLVKDGADILSPDDYENFVRRAVEVYSKKKPRVVVADLEGDGTGDFDIAGLEGFDPEFSGDPIIEFPISESGEPNLIDRRFWKFYRKPDGMVIRFLEDNPSAGQEARFTFNAQHTITTEASTIPESDFFAVCKYGAADACDDLARYYTQTAENALGDITSATFNTKSREYESRGKKLREQANDHVGAGSADSGTPAASVTKNWDTRNSMGGDRLTHPRRRR